LQGDDLDGVEVGLNLITSYASSSHGSSKYTGTVNIDHSRATVNKQSSE